MSENDKIIDDIVSKINKELKVFVSSCKDIINSEKLKLDILSLTENERINLNKIKQYVDGLDKNELSIEGDNPLDSLGIELDLNQDFKGKKIRYIRIDNEKILASSMKTAIVKFCEYLAKDDIDKFMSLVHRMPKVFNKEEDKSKASKLIKGTKTYINTQKNNSDLARTIIRISKEYDFDSNRIKISVE